MYLTFPHKHTNHFFIKVKGKHIAQAISFRFTGASHPIRFVPYMILGNVCAELTSMKGHPCEWPVGGQWVSTYTRALYSTVASANDSRLGLAS